MSIGQDLLNVPMGEMIYAIASSIAASQLKLDQASIETAEMMGGLKTIVDDQGMMQFTDSRVFFGHEYMTPVDALVTQGTGNKFVENLVAGLSLKYNEYHPPFAPATVDPPSPSMSPVNDTLSLASVADYHHNQKAIRERIVYLQGRLAGATKTQALAIDVVIKALQKLDADNSAGVAAIFEHQVQVPTRLSLLELGFAPVFYAFVDTIIEVKIAISITESNSSTTTTGGTERSVSGKAVFGMIPFLGGGFKRTRQVQTAQTNATYTNSYSYSADGSSLLRTKLSPVPTPAILEERIRAIMTADREQRAAQIQALTALATTTPTPAPPPPPPPSAPL